MNKLKQKVLLNEEDQAKLREIASRNHKRNDFLNYLVGAKGGILSFSQSGSFSKNYSESTYSKKSL